MSDSGMGPLDLLIAIAGVICLVAVIGSLSLIVVAQFP